MSKMDLWHGDCLELMKNIPDNSIDLVLTDPPYRKTACAWDVVIPFEPMWEQLKRITKERSAICLFGSEPFSSHLRLSNLKMFKYDWVWDKKFAANFVQSKRMPLKINECISIFCNNGCPMYFPIMIKRESPIMNGGNVTKPGGAIPITGKKKEEYLKKGRPVFYEKYPETILRYSSREGRGIHPTQKPVSLLEYLIKTYTLEGETVLDFTAGSFSTGVACVNTGRSFIGIEKDDHYFSIGKKRVEDTLNAKLQK